MDQGLASFSAGTAGAATSVTASGVTLKPQVAEDFSALPPTSQWQSFSWGFDGPGSSAVTDGQLVVNGARFVTQPASATFGPGTSVEFMATFNAGNNQHVGFGAGGDEAPEMFNTVPWILISTGANGASATGLLARVHNGTEDLITALPGNLIGAAHTYRIDWKASSIDFYVDGVLAHTQNITLTTPMRVGVSDVMAASPGISVDWIRITPYASSGSFTSRIYDGSTAKTWQEATWTADTPAGTTVQLFQRQGNSTNPEDGTWTPFTAIASSGTVIGGTSRFLQYRADLATSNPAVTPTLQRMGINCAEATCADVAFTPTAGAVLPNATVGAFYSQTITTSPEAYNLVASGLPAGLTLEPATGLLSGKATAEATGAVITITATKGNCTAEATYTLTVQAANQPPVLAAIAPQSVAALATLSFTATATDADTDVSSLRFSLAGTVPDKAVIDAETGVFSWTPVLEQVGSHTFKVMVSDGIASGEQELTVTVTSPAPTDISLSSQSVEENKPTGTVVGSFSTASANAAQTYAYSLMAGEGDSGNASFQIAGSDLQTAAGFDFESKASYSIRVRATSSEAGGPTFEKAFTIAVNDANEAPVMTANTFNVAEGTANGVTVGTLSATDPDANQLLTYSITGGNTNNAFIIVGDALEVNNSAALDYATTPSFSLTVQATDSGNPALSASATITVNVTDVNGAPVIADQSFSLDENTRMKPPWVR
ncbi:cadherin domain-containing protein [Hymenobacter sp. DG25B]|uniref:cadherin domain-containing protein n=1 Tax=Hymenobacter sp. DG25B TaxID=1385664 RepID=UPI0006932934|nr:cadherin domain-containing protein [Hymenobacter sp. DG25B]